MFASHFHAPEPMSLLQGPCKTSFVFIFPGPIAFIRFSEEELTPPKLGLSAECFLDWDDRVADLRNSTSLELRLPESSSVGSCLLVQQQTKPHVFCSDSGPRRFVSEASSVSRGHPASKTPDVPGMWRYFCSEYGIVSKEKKHLDRVQCGHTFFLFLSLLPCLPPWLQVDFGGGTATTRNF